jgi:hypothetical protein
MIRLRTLVKPAGELVVLDLCRSRTVVDQVRILVAAQVYLRLRISRTGQLNDTPAVRAAWDAHGTNAVYPSLREAQGACKTVVPAATEAVTLAVLADLEEAE